jgi:peptidoglycan/xylan/chitin deacetylase (PgdA/CDA1 family)
MLDCGVFTISLDFELIWGTLDLFGPERFREACATERLLIDRLLELFVEFDISATWCTLGHLFLDGCRAEDGVKHPEIVRPAHAWCRRDWFEHDPCGCEEDEPLFFGGTLVAKIRACPVPQEIGCHSFSHVIFGDDGCSAATAASELAACLHLAGERGIELRSFAFPRNRVGHLDVLREHGFVCYRGPEPVWHERRAWPEAVKRLGRLWEVCTVRTPSGLWNIPGSMIYFPMHGWRRHVPLSWRVKRAVKGLHAAARDRRIFHLWFHPTNLADQSERMFEGLRQILEQARILRDQGRLAVMSMGGVVETLPISEAAER